MQVMDFLGFEITATPILILGATVLVYLYLTWNHDFWKNQGIPGPRPLPLVGNLFQFVIKGAVQSDCDLIKKYGKIVGVFTKSSPDLITSDLDIIKQAMIKEFPSFMDRNPKSMVIDESPINKMITNITGDHWKHIRRALSPAFSGNKLKKMMLQMSRCADLMAENVIEKADSGEQFELKEFAGAYSLDVIAAVGFGVQANTQTDPDDQFAKYAKKAAANTLPAAVLLWFFLPKVYSVLRKFTNISLMQKDVKDFFIGIVSQAMQHRKEQGEERTDFLQLMIDAKIDDPKPEDVDEEISGIFHDQSGVWSSKGLTEEEIFAQSLIFFLAGYETTASTMSLLAYNLALNPECQEKLNNEIKTVVGNKDIVTYEMVHQMPYMDMCIQESMRLYPPAFRLQRSATKDITVNGINIHEGCIIGIAAYSIHHDPELWPEPETFKPERFTPEAKAARDPVTYLPFGLGPRNCIGMRLAQIEMKVAFAKLLLNVKLTKCAKTEIPLQFRKLGMLYSKNGIYLKAEKRQ